MGVSVNPKLAHQFLTRLAMPLIPPETTRRLLAEFVDLDVNAEAVAGVIQNNQYIEFMMLLQIKQLGLKDVNPTLKAAIALMGMQRARDFVCALQMLRGVTGKHLEVSADGKLDFKASDHLKYASKTEEYMSARKMAGADLGYAAGMMFDFVRAIANELFKADKTFDEALAEVYKHGLKAAYIGAEIVKTQKSFTFSRYVFPACLVHDIGKLAMELLFPASEGPKSYKKFREDIAKSGILPRNVRYFLERQRFGMTHEYYSSQMVHHFQIFQEAERAVLFHHEPGLLKAAGKDLHQFANLIALCSNIANQIRIPKDVSDPVFQVWLTPELKDVKWDLKMLLTVMTKIGRESF